MAQVRMLASEQSSIRSAMAEIRQIGEGSQVFHMLKALDAIMTHDLAILSLINCLMGLALLLDQ